MTTMTERPSAAAVRLTDTRTLARWTAAILMPIGPAAVAVLRFILPYDTNDSAAVMIAKVQAAPDTQQAVMVLGLIAVFTLVPGAYAVARLTRPGAPRLTAVAAPLLIAGYLGLSCGAMVDLLPLVAPAAGVEPAELAPLLVAVMDHPAGLVPITIFVVGHILGTVLLGFALWRSGSVHWVWAVLMGISQPLHLVAAMTGNHPLDLLGWGLTAIVMGVAAVQVLRTSDDDWDVPPRSGSRLRAGDER